jgi:ABC-2 type transport system ATP-binding protein
MSTSQPVVAVHDLTRRYESVTALANVTLDVAPGTIVGIIGPSGSGKTTLVRVLTGTLRPTEGSVRVLGEEPLHFRRWTRERLGYMPQQFTLYEELTPLENLSFVAALFGLLWRRRRRRMREVLELLGLWDARDRRTRQLSGGMQRRLALACAMVHEPQLLFLDEPTAGLDPIMRETIWHEFRRLRDAGQTLVVTTQYVGEAAYCDRVAVLAEGLLLAFAAPDELRRDAVGGEELEIETSGVFDGNLLTQLPGVKQVRQTGPRRLLVVADDASVATPRVLEAVTSQGAQVTSSAEYKPSFDEVFAELVERKRASRNGKSAP